MFKLAIIGIWLSSVVFATAGTSYFLKWRSEMNRVLSDVSVSGLVASSAKAALVKASNSSDVIPDPIKPPVPIKPVVITKPDTFSVGDKTGPGIEREVIKEAELTKPVEPVLPQVTKPDLVNKNEGVEPTAETADATQTKLDVATLRKQQNDQLTVEQDAVFEANESKQDTDRKLPSAPIVKTPEPAISIGANDVSTLKTPSTPQKLSRDSVAEAVQVQKGSDLGEKQIAQLSDESEKTTAIETPASVSIKRGDNLWNISKSRYGLGHLYPLIFNANREKVSDPDLIYPGQVLTVPGR